MSPTSMGPLRNVILSARANSLRGLFAATGIVVAVGSALVVLGVTEGARREVLRQVATLGIDRIVLRSVTSGRPGAALGPNSRPLAASDLVRLEKSALRPRWLGGARGLSARVQEGAASRHVPMLAVSGRYMTAAGLEVVDGRGIADLDCVRRARVCVLGPDLARSLGARGHVGSTIHLAGAPFRVVGLLQSRNGDGSKAGPVTTRDTNALAIVPFGTEPQETRGEPPIPTVDEIVVVVEDADRVDAAAILARRVLDGERSSRPSYEVVVPRELLRRAGETHRLFTVTMSCLAAVSLVMGGIGVFNVMLASVRERVREIGIRRSLGATPRDIGIQFLGEALLVSVTGAVVGIALGLLAALALRSFTGWSIAITPSATLAAFLIVIVVGLAAGFHPALRAARLDPAAAMRSV